VAGWCQSDRCGFLLILATLSMARTKRGPGMVTSFWNAGPTRGTIFCELLIANHITTMSMMNGDTV
jgi:hypothetical protein